MRTTRRSWGIALAALATGAVVLPTPAREDVDLLHRDGPPPASPRYAVASGVFGEDWDGPPAGKRWDLLVWGDGRTTCWQVVEEGHERNEGRACSRNRAPDAIPGMTFVGSRTFYTGSRDPGEYMFVAGEVGPRVDRLVFRNDRGADSSIPLLRPPPGTGGPYLYYATVLPRFDFARLVALSRDGEVIATSRLCGIGCTEGRWDDERIAIRAWERVPVTLESAAAAFANAAAGQAGLIDQLGTLWRYRGISDDLVATFRARECSSCNDGAGPASITVGVKDETFYVVAAAGPMSDEQRDSFEAYTEPVTDEAGRWRVVTESFARAGPHEWDAAFAMVWTGNMGAPGDYESACTSTVYGAGGEVVDRRRDLPFPVRDGERHRVNRMLVSVAAPGRPADLDVECEPARPAFFD